MTSPRIWLVGASQGIGLALCKRLLAEGYRIVASARSATQNTLLQTWQAQYPDQLALLDCDIEEEDLQSVSHQAWHAFDGLDWWFYNVGDYKPMRCQDWHLPSFAHMNQCNYFGAVKLMLRLQELSRGKSMRWLWNISLAADFGLPYGGGYSAPKAALLNLAESLQPELAQQGIALQIINHGFVKTRLTAKNQFAMPGLMTAEEAAAKILRFMQTSSPKRFELRFPFSLSLLLAILKRLPKQWSLALTKKMLHSGD